MKKTICCLMVLIQLLFPALTQASSANPFLDDLPINMPQEGGMSEQDSSLYLQDTPTDADQDSIIETRSDISVSSSSNERQALTGFFGVLAIIGLMSSEPELALGALAGAAIVNADNLPQLANEVTQGIEQAANSLSQLAQQLEAELAALSDALSGISRPDRPSPTATRPTQPPPPTTPTRPTPSRPTRPTGDLSMSGQTTSPSDNVSSPSDASRSVEELRAEMRRTHNVNPVDGSARWTSAQLAATNNLLSTLPNSFKRHTQNIKRERLISNHPNVLGSVALGIPTVNIADSATRSRSTWEGTIIHEMTHTFQANNREITARWERQFWNGNRPRSASVSHYGNTCPLEDMAEAVRAYWQAGPRMKQSHPDRYEFVRQFIMDGKEF